jgi:hypothetical protein
MVAAMSRGQMRYEEARNSRLKTYEKRVIYCSRLVHRAVSRDLAQGPLS